jgi:[ribosomal protein S5]-alanine N-acetyltransferase
MKHKGTILIETDRLILRKFKSTDSSDMFKNWGSDDNVTKYLSWQTHKDINEVIGTISILKLENIHYACEIGYCISSRYWNKGIIIEAFKSIIKCLFEEVGFNRICAKNDINNVASGKVIQKCRMIYEGTLREVQFRNNKFWSLAVYSILKKEWLS